MAPCARAGLQARSGQNLITVGYQFNGGAQPERITVRNFHLHVYCVGDTWILAEHRGGYFDLSSDIDIKRNGFVGRRSRPRR